MSDYTLALGNRLNQPGGLYKDITRQMTGWRRKIRRTGGFTEGSATYRGEPDDVFNFFATGLGCRLKETLGSKMTWDGIIYSLALNYGQVCVERSIGNMSNRVKVVYSSSSQPNQILNPSVEASLANWSKWSEGSPIHVDFIRSNAWAADGQWSIYMTNDDSGVTAGVVPALTPGFVPTVNTEYVFRVNLAPQSNFNGNWIEIIRSDGALLASSDEVKYPFSGVVEVKFSCTMAAPVGIHILGVNNSDCYIDNAYFYPSKYSGDTGWRQDAIAIADWGIIENILSLGSMTDEAAVEHAVNEVALRAFPRNILVDSLDFGGANQKNELSVKVTAAGRIATLTWVYVEGGGGRNTVSALVRGLLSPTRTPYIFEGYIANNPTLYELDTSTYSPRVWDALSDLLQVGYLGQQFTAGVYEDGAFYYEPIGTTPRYKIRNGDQVFNMDDTRADPCLVRPAPVQVEIPVTPGAMATITDGEIEEVEFEAPDTIHFKKASRNR